MAVALLTPEELRAIVREEVRAAVREALASQPERSALTTEQAAAELGILPKTVRAWAAEGRIQGSKQGRSWRFSAAQIEAARHPAGALADDVLRKLG